MLNERDVPDRLSNGLRASRDWRLKSRGPLPRLFFFSCGEFRLPYLQINLDLTGPTWLNLLMRLTVRVHEHMAYNPYFRASLCLPLFGYVALVSMIDAATSVRAEEPAQRIETGSLPKDAMVAPVRRVFPKTPTDRELRRLSRAVTAKPKESRKRKKR